MKYKTLIFALILLKIGFSSNGQAEEASIRKLYAPYFLQQIAAICQFPTIDHNVELENACLQLSKDNISLPQSLSTPPPNLTSAQKINFIKTECTKRMQAVDTNNLLEIFCKSLIFADSNS